MKLLIRTLLSILLFVPLICSCEKTGGESDNLRKKYIQRQDPIIISGPLEGDGEETYKKYIPLLKYIEKEVETPVEMIIPFDFNDLEKKIKFEEIDAAFLDPAQYYLLSKYQKYNIVISRIFNENIRSSCIIVSHIDWKFLSLTQLKGKSFAYLSDKSALGYYVPHKMLTDVGVGKFKVMPVFEDSYEGIINRVLNKTVHAGTLYCGDNKKNAIDCIIPEEEDLKKSMLTILKLKGNIPAPVIAFSNRFSDNRLSMRLATALLSINEDEFGKKIMEDLKSRNMESGYQSADMGKYEKFREMYFPEEK